MLQPPVLQAPMPAAPDPAPAPAPSAPPVQPAPVVVDPTAAPAPDPAPPVVAPQQPVPPAPLDLSNLTREQLETRVRTLTENLAAANIEAEYFRKQWSDLKLRNEALGVEALTVDQKRLEDKVVQSVAELYRSEMKRREALQVLDDLVSSAGQLLLTAPNYDPAVRAKYEVAKRRAPRLPGRP